MKRDDKNLNSVVLLLLFFIIMIFVYIFKFKKFDSLFWLCYTGIALIIIGILKRNSTLILSQILILAIVDSFWIFDFIMILLNGESLISVATNIFSPEVNILLKIITIQHLLTVPLAIYALSIVKIKKDWKVLIPVLFQLELFFLATRIFTNPLSNINCVSKTCASIGWGENIYPLAWIITMFGFALITYFIIIQFPIFIKENKKK